jgi:hypothetical protein
MMGANRRWAMGWTAALVAAGSLAGAGCGEDECTGAACETDAGAADSGGTDAGPPDGGPTDSGPPTDGGPPDDTGGGDSGMEVDAGPPPCVPWTDPNACVAMASCPDPATVRLRIEQVASVSTDAMANPEIVKMIPGETNRAVVISAVSNQLGELIYDATSISFMRNVRLMTGTDTSVTTSVEIAPDASFAAVTVAEADCALGRVLFVDISATAAFGTVLGSVAVGYEPDSSAFSADGRYLVTADEDDRADRPCKPVDRFGGSITVVDLSMGPAMATVAQTIAVNHAMDSEPEGLAISASGTVAVAIQETGEVGIFQLADVPAATLMLVTLPTGSEPDGIAFSSDGRFLAVGYERTDTLAILDATTRAILTEHVIAGTGEVPDEYPRDDRRTTKVHEPEQLTFVRSRGALFVVESMQESAGVVAFAIGTGGTVTFDSIAHAGVDYASVAMARMGSAIGPEGITWSAISGMLIGANEREGSVTLYRTEAVMPVTCP